MCEVGFTLAFGFAGADAGDDPEDDREDEDDNQDEDPHRADDDSTLDLANFIENFNFRFYLVNTDRWGVVPREVVVTSGAWKDNYCGRIFFVIVN